MGNTEITSDIISRRLGRGAQSSVYETDEPKNVVEVVESEDSSAGFMVMMLVLFLAVGGGTYFFAGSDLSWYELKLAISRLALFRS